MRRRTVIKWLVILAVTAAAFKMGQAAALSERGYAAIGGEYLLLLLPVLYWAVERNVEDTKAAVKQPPEDTARGYTLTREKTGYIFYHCLDCERDSVFPARTSDGRRCPNCGGHIVPRGYAKRVNR